MKNQTEPLSSLLNMNDKSSTIGKDFVEETISHIGVRGMRWGIRKSRSAIYAARQKKSERKNIEGKADVKKMTDAEMKTVINRIKLEQEYKKLTTVPSKLDKGKAAVGQILVKSLTAGGAKVVESYLGPIVQKAMLDKSKASKAKSLLPKGSPLPPPRANPPKPNT